MDAGYPAAPRAVALSAKDRCARSTQVPSKTRDDFFEKQKNHARHTKKLFTMKKSILYCAPDNFFYR
jgi:hypothetical protein